MSIFDKIFEENNVNNIVGLNNELKALYVFNLFKKSKKSILFLTSTLYEANKYYQMISNYSQDVVLFPMDDFLTSEALAISPELKISRLETLNLIVNTKKIIVTNLMGYLRFLPSKDLYVDKIIKLEVGKELNFNNLLNFLCNLGYKRETIVNKTGEFAVRGFIIDIFPLGYSNPVRVEFWGDVIENIREFDVDNQLTIKEIKDIEIIPYTEFIVDSDDKIENFLHRDIVKYITPSSIYKYLENGLLVINDYDTILNNYELLLAEMKNYSFNNGLSTDTRYMNIFEVADESRTYYLTDFDNKNSENYKKYNVLALENFVGTSDDINKRLINYLNNKYIVIICLSSRYKINKIINDLNNNNLIFTDDNNIFAKKINLIVKNISTGYIIDNIVVIGEKEIFNKKDDGYIYKTNFKLGTKIRDINKLQIGDYIVHNQHGIGIYCGLKTINKNGLKKDYIYLEYKDNDKLYIPVERLELISKYSSNDNVKPRLNKLGGIEWQKTKLRVKNKIQSIAGDLLKLYAEREHVKGISFKKDDDTQLAFEKEFIYEETLDQLKATEEIKKDMEKPHPMDRLLCGDVGYGKTEVAFRAIFKAILSGKQVAFLCPTTILSTQHYNNAIERFRSFPVEIEVLNRFVNIKKKNEIIENLNQGKIDLLIGTHRILSNDVVFKNLGLLVVDEEQRFGVTHKEKIKQFKNNIDVLTLSATPIPRTLQMSMSGIRSLSLIETPPVNRYPVQTYVLAENNQIIKDAIYKELSRQGQVFILCNRIEEMDTRSKEILHLVPEAKIVSAHGRMDKNELENVMIKFQNKEYDVLVCTTIIETGIDIPNVNTLIIIDADRFGLSQLYQIRGRVGRGNKIAYCYLMYKKGKVLSDVSIKRLNVIKEFTELGSGFAIAMRDLSIRGAGDILGNEQAGFIDSIGVELFLKMLNDEINRLKGIEILEKEVSIKPLIEVSTAIDDKYAAEEELKIEIHKKINSIDSNEKLDEVKNELEDRFGRLDNEIIVYMYEELFEHMCSELGINKVNQTKNSISLHVSSSILKNINGDRLFNDLCSLNRKIRFAIKNSDLIITLNIVNLDKHYIFYLIDIINIIKSNKK